MPTRPTGRKTQVTSGGTGVHKGEQYHGSGPVGREASGSRPSSGSSMPGGGRNVSSGGSYPGGSRGSGGGGLLRLIIIGIIILVGGGGSLGALLGGCAYLLQFPKMKKQ